MKKQAVERTNKRSVLDTRFNVDPVKKGFNGLTAADTRVETVTGAQRIVYPPLARHNDVDISSFREESGPGSIRVSAVSKQCSVTDWSAAPLQPLRGPEVTKRRLADLCRDRDRQFARTKHCEDIQFHAMIPLFSGGIEAFVV